MAGTKNTTVASADEALAKEALEGLKRSRAKARLDKMAIPKPAPAVVRPAILVAKPPPPRPAWVIPLASLAFAVGLVVSACTGVMAYLTLPGQTNVTANAEIRMLRETVAQLRKQMAGVSENLDGLRTAVDLSSKATHDRFSRFAENLDRVERASSSSATKLDRLALQAQVPVPASAPSQPAPASVTLTASATSAPEFTGSASPPDRALPIRKPVRGWAVRQAYEGVAILQGPNGVVEAILGQQVPGLGRIEEIGSENGRLVVFSSSGAIYSARKGMP